MIESFGVGTPRVTVPALRTFEVTRRLDVLSPDDIQTTVVHAHELSFGPTGQLCFVVLVADATTNELYSTMPRVFNAHAWDDVEEILRSTSLLSH